jgi:hypothetical protein
LKINFFKCFNSSKRKLNFSTEQRKKVVTFIKIQNEIIDTLSNLDVSNSLQHEQLASTLVKKPIVVAKQIITNYANDSNSTKKLVEDTLKHKTIFNWLEYFNPNKLKR